MNASIRAGALAATLSAVASVAVLAQASGFESAPTLAGSRLAPSALLKGPGYEAVDPVAVDRFLGRFELRTPYGTFRLHGADLLALRVDELRAIEALSKVEGSAAFTEALAKAAAAPVKVAGSLVTDPGATVENIASGAGTVLGRVGYSVKAGVRNVGDAMSAPSSPAAGTQQSTAGGEPPSYTADSFGYNRARREWARKLDIDPYTSNPVLRPLLDNAASATFAGQFAVGVAVGAVAAPLRHATVLDSAVRDAAWDQPPGDLAKANDHKLRKMGVPDEVVRAYLRNRWYTPTLQTALVAALQRLDRASGRDAVIRAASTVAGEVPARFLLRSIDLLGDYHRDSPVAQIRMRGIVPIAKGKDGSIVAAAAVDYLYWSEETASFARAQELAGPRRILLLQGDTSARAATELGRAGWNVRAGLRPIRGS